ncbi:MAG: cupin domain-containing protein [Firmicutes bacterium]|jgi:putative monooxygenase|nr:cupin domain-containing protein [Bacillota bacterium]
MAKVIVRESEVEGARREPPRVSKILISEHTVGARQISMGTNVTEPGSRIPLHKHTDQEEAMFVISGKGKLICGGEEYDLEPGTAIFSPVGVEHEIINVGDEPFKIVWAYAPPLPEHLKK